MKETRNTSQKDIIRKEILLQSDHLTADQIYVLVKEKMPCISRATVFRNLKKLAEMGEIGFVPTMDGADCFDYRNHNHYHFKCNECHRIFDTDIPYDQNLDKVDSEFKILKHETLFYGICPECLAKHTV